MPKDKNIKSILIIGSGPIIIGQACEFDYSGSQALRSLREDGIKTVLINSNPATIMTDPSMADHIYLKPLTTKSISEILEIHNDIDAVLPTMGGQTALNLCIEAQEKEIWSKYSVKIIGVDIDAIEITEDREKFRKLLNEINIPVAPAESASSFLKGKEIAQKFGFPLVIRPSFTLGGTGASIVFEEDKFNDLLIEKRVRPTALLPLWNVAGFALGAGTALMGEKAAMACTVAVEKVIGEHYREQQELLKDDEKELRKTIAKFEKDELEHHDIGLEHDAENAPGYKIMTKVIEIGCKTAIAISKKI